MLHNIPKEEVYARLIDIYRLHVRDELASTREVGYDRLNDTNQTIKYFRRFLSEVQKCPGFLPSWWSLARRRECEEIAVDKNQRVSLAFPVELSDIMQRHQSHSMVLAMRMFASRVYG